MFEHLPDQEEHTLAAEHTRATARETGQGTEANGQRTMPDARQGGNL